MNDLIEFALGITIAVIIVGAATLPLGLDPTIGNKYNVTNGTDLSYVINVTALETNYTRFTLASPDTAYDGLGTVTWAKFGSNYLNITDVTGTVLAQATASPATFNITGTLLLSTTNINFSSNSSDVKHAPNVTSVQIDYRATPESTQQGWDTGTTILYRVIVPIAVILALILYFTK